MGGGKRRYHARWGRVKEAVIPVLVRGIPAGGRVNAMRNALYRRILARLGTGAIIYAQVDFADARGIEVGNRVSIWPYTHLYCHGPNNHIRLADHVILDRGVVIKALNRDADQHTCIEIGARTLVGPYTCLFGPGSITIGSDCLISSHTGIYANNHHYTDPTRPIHQQGISRKGIVIEDDCWLGSGVQVLDGVTIGRGSVVSAGSVVMRDVPPYAIVAGVPAKVIGYRHAPAQHAPDEEPVVPSV